jgi:tRNA(Arg) A34 adenosine deaminase TadA
VAASRSYPPKPSAGPLHDLWDSSVRELVSLPAPALEAGEIDRHQIFSHLLLALVAHYFNGNKHGTACDYSGWRDQQRVNGQYPGGNYLGHNIACLAVDARGEPIDFDFNHNEVFNSSVEHAESRLVRRIFSLTQIYDNWATKGPKDPPPQFNYVTQLQQVTIYTSLESCSQCSGIMALGAVRQVVFLHRDPGQYSIGNILRKLTPADAASKPPLPIPGNLIGVEAFDELEKGYLKFSKEVVKRPFGTATDGKPDNKPSITSFLCTDLARDIFLEGQKTFATMKCEKPLYKPKDDKGIPVAGGLTNRLALRRARAFYNYAISNGGRGTPHKL